MSYLEGLPSEKTVALYTKRDLVSLFTRLYDSAWISYADIQKAQDPRTSKSDLVRAMRNVYVRLRAQQVEDQTAAIDRRADRTAGVVRDSNGQVVAIVPAKDWWSCQSEVDGGNAPYYEWLFPELTKDWSKYDREADRRCNHYVEQYEASRRKDVEQKEGSPEEWINNMVRLFGTQKDPVIQASAGYAGFILPDGQYVSLPEGYTSTGFLFHDDAVRQACPYSSGDKGYYRFLRETGSIRFHLWGRKSLEFMVKNQEGRWTGSAAAASAGRLFREALRFGIRESLVDFDTGEESYSDYATVTTQEDLIKLLTTGEKPRERMRRFDGSLGVPARRKYKYYWQERKAAPDDPNELRIEGVVVYYAAKYASDVRAYPAAEDTHLWQPILAILNNVGAKYADRSYSFADETTAQLVTYASNRDQLAKHIVNVLRPESFTYNNGRLTLRVRIREVR